MWGSIRARRARGCASSSTPAPAARLRSKTHQCGRGGGCEEFCFTTRRPSKSRRRSGPAGPAYYTTPKFIPPVQSEHCDASDIGEDNDGQRGPHDTGARKLAHDRRSRQVELFFDGNGPQRPDDRWNRPAPGDDAPVVSGPYISFTSDWRCRPATRRRRRGVRLKATHVDRSTFVFSCSNNSVMR